MPVVESEYRAPRWLRGGHLQTIVPAKFFSRPAVEYRRELVEMPDGDVRAFDWVQNEPSDPSAPVLVHFHGLEGSSRSHYAEMLMHSVAQRGWRGVVAQFRGCGGVSNRLPRAYFAGDVDDAQWALDLVHDRFKEAPIFAVGVSLGGNQLAKLLGDRPIQMSYVQAAASISAPVDLVAGSENLRDGFNRLYAANFLSTLREKVKEKAVLFPGLIDYSAALKSKTLYEFDEAFTAPLHGFSTAMEYWTVCSAKQVLKDVKTPLLLLNAKNDPFLPAWALPTQDDVSESVWLEQPEEGGHVGFPTGGFPGEMNFLPNRVLSFLERFLP